MPTRFEPEGGDRDGFWGPSTSSIDWCERNYEVTYYVAEFFNAISSIGLVVVGLFTIYTVRGVVGSSAEWAKAHNAQR